MTTIALYVICFVAGIAVHRAYRDDDALNVFADATLAVARFPAHLARRLTAAEPAETMAIEPVAMRNGSKAGRQTA